MGPTHNLHLLAAVLGFRAVLRQAPGCVCELVAGARLNLLHVGHAPIEAPDERRHEVVRVQRLRDLPDRLLHQVSACLRPREQALLFAALLRAELRVCHMLDAASVLDNILCVRLQTVVAGFNVLSSGDNVLG